MTNPTGSFFSVVPTSGADLSPSYSTKRPSNINAHREAGSSTAPLKLSEVAVRVDGAANPHKVGSNARSYRHACTNSSLANGTWIRRHPHASVSETSNPTGYRAPVVNGNPSVGAAAAPLPAPPLARSKTDFLTRSRSTQRLAVLSEEPSVDASKTTKDGASQKQESKKAAAKKETSSTARAPVRDAPLSFTEINDAIAEIMRPHTDQQEDHEMSTTQS